jgi:ectoine hydroxylase-related dioxygenase (phytanoyl-CoA dioxygenase family)
MSYKKLTQEDKEVFDRDGYLLVRSMFSSEEIDLLYGIAKNDEVITRKSFDRGDKEGLRTRLALWYSLDDNIYSLVARLEKIVSAVEMFLEGEAAHFHSKLMQKEPRVGGAWEWHQDYGYWYRDGFLFPHMLSVLTALTPSTIENGCLQVIKGSHKLGRVDHGAAGEQVGANQERVDESLKRMELVYVEMEPGDTLFFHSNTLHRSDRNDSDTSRWSLISAYNLITNKPFKGTNTSSYTPIRKVPDIAILEYNAGSISEEADFLVK